MPGKSPTVTFEKNLNELEAIVNKMEEGSLSLDESLRAFEEGVKLARNCQKTLAAAEQKVRILADMHINHTSEPDNEPATEPFDINSPQDKHQ